MFRTQHQTLVQVVCLSISNFSLNLEKIFIFKSTEEPIVVVIFFTKPTQNVVSRIRCLPSNETGVTKHIESKKTNQRKYTTKRWLMPSRIEFYFRKRNEHWMGKSNEKMCLILCVLVQNPIIMNTPGGGVSVSVCVRARDGEPVPLCVRLRWVRSSSTHSLFVQKRLFMLSMLIWRSSQTSNGCNSSHNVLNGLVLAVQCQYAFQRTVFCSFYFFLIQLLLLFLCYWNCAINVSSVKTFKKPSNGQSAVSVPLGHSVIWKSWRI